MILTTSLPAVLLSAALKLSRLPTSSAFIPGSLANPNYFRTAQSHTVEWTRLQEAVEGRLFTGTPFALPCFVDHGDDPEAAEKCRAIRASYTDEVTRANTSTAYINTQWETCQATGEQCLLDWTNSTNDAPTKAPNTCGRGSVSETILDVRKPEDVSAAFAFSRRTKVPLIIRNTGHDYKGRSSAPDSLALWTHNLKKISYDATFVPEGCKTKSSAVTMGAGIQFQDLYAFADENNITVVGGSDRSVGASGGWLQGGGHGPLSNTLGLGVDRALQFKIVTPDGRYRVANACQNQDLFFALRGGGGGTFGVVLESTILASPRLTIQAVLITFSPNITNTERLWSLMAERGANWAENGWGGLGTSEIAIYLKPMEDKAKAEKEMKPLIDLGHEIGATVLIRSFESWAMSSRLVTKTSFVTAENRSALVSALLSAKHTVPRLIIQSTSPASYSPRQGPAGDTSVTDAWRSALWHVTVVAPWNWDATLDVKKAAYESVSKAMNGLRDITADAAYSNEADVYEPNHEFAFWGTHYERLLSIKNQYDPERLLDCWQCVGWNPESSRFKCYL